MGLDVIKGGGAGNVFDKIKEDVLMDLVEGAIPKIKPFLVPALEKMNEWFGDDTKTIIIKKNKGQKAKVVIFDNTKGEYKIEKSESKEINIFTADQECIIGVYEIEEFMTKMISGDITKLLPGK